jgi:polyisoprenoid-binding protein YceI
MRKLKKIGSAALLAMVCLGSMSFVVNQLIYSPVQEDSEVSFKIKNLGKMVDGTLGNLKGSIIFDPENVADAKIDAKVDISTINTGIGQRNKHLQAEEYFNAEKYPNIIIESSAITIENAPEGKAKMVGNINIKGKKKPVTLIFSYVKTEKGYNMKSNFVIKRKDFGVGSKKTSIMKNDVVVNLNIFVQ